MRFIADLHIHSHLSRATSKQLAPEYLDLWARLKGISVIGTGDFTHPDWLKELHEKLEPAEEGLFRLKPAYRQRAVVPKPPTLSQETRFVLQAEISSIYKKDGRTRKVHNVILAPDFETVEKIRQSLLSMNANLTSDGRPILGLDSHDLLEISLEASEHIAFIPAHIWTPWFSILGSKSGFDTVEECFEDLTPHLTAMETGLSTDAPMHWTCTFLDPFTLISNSDAHSPEKLGRNANIFDTELSYPAMISALKEGDPKAFLGTIDLFPQEGKYHYDGHRKCNVVWNPLETLHHNGLCPVCGKKVTVGVMHRVAQLADRDDLKSRPNRLPFVSIIPLKEILSEIFEVGAASKRVDTEYHTLLRRFGPELYILLDLPAIELIKGGKPLVGEALRRMRERRVIIQEGYDGEYGVSRVFKEGEARSVTVQQALFSSTAADGSVPQHRLINFDLKAYKDLYARQRGFEPEQLAFEAPAVEIKRKPLLSGLNSEQQRAARHSTGPALILAGPGTGKTRTLTYRVAHLIQDLGVAPESILAVTFTNKAASEIGQRLNELLPGEGQKHKPRVSTFHAFGYSALKEHADAFGRSGSFSLVDESDKRHILGKSLGCPRQEISKVSNDLSRAKQELTPLNSDPDGAASPFWKPYEEYCRENDLFDLDDCIYRPVRLFLEHPEVRKDFQGRGCSCRGPCPTSVSSGIRTRPSTASGERMYGSSRSSSLHRYHPQGFEPCDRPLHRAGGISAGTSGGRQDHHRSPGHGPQRGRVCGPHHRGPHGRTALFFSGQQPDGRRGPQRSAQPFRLRSTLPRQRPDEGPGAGLPEPQHPLPVHRRDTLLPTGAGQVGRGCVPAGSQSQESPAP